MTIHQIKKGIQSYYKDCLLPMSWSMSLLEPLVTLSINNFERKYKTAIQMIVDEDGEIDIEMLYEEYRRKIQSLGSVELLGLKFNASDLDKLMEHIRKQEVTA